MHELRKDPVLSRWVAVLSESRPPGAYRSLEPGPAETGCILCRGREGEAPAETGSISSGDGWLVRSVQSTMPVLVPEGALARRGAGMYDRMNSIGVNEIVVESPEHATPPEDMGAGQVARVFELYQRRMREIGSDERIRCVLIYKNFDMLSGPANSHPHSQIIATPVIPLRVKSELDGAKAYFSYKERCIFCDMVDEELRAGERVVVESEHFVAFCPFASRFPFEVWVVPKRHSCEFQSASREEIEDMGGVMGALMKKIRKILKEPSYSYVIHSAPMRIPRRNHWHTLGDDFHWHVELVPRLLSPAGFEWGTGFYVLTTSPEDAARHLREA